MKAKFLLPHRFKFFGWCLLMPGVALGVFYLLTDLEPEWLEVNIPDIFHQSAVVNSNPSDALQVLKNNLVDEIIASLILLAGLFLMLAREKYEDELIMKLRLESLLWAAIVNAILILSAIWIVYEAAFFQVMMVALVLYYLLFVFRFYWVLAGFKAAGHEE